MGLGGFGWSEEDLFGVEKSTAGKGVGTRCGAGRGLSLVPRRGSMGLHCSLPPLQELELQAQLHGLPLSPPTAAPLPDAGGSEEETPGAPPFPPSAPQCLLDLALPHDLELPLGLGVVGGGGLDDLLMDEGGGLEALGPPGTLVASPVPSYASSPRSSLSMEDDP